MPEPSGQASFAGEIVPGLFRYTMHDDRIDFQSDGYVLVNQGRVVLIDPLPMPEPDLARYGLVEAICLTASCHERAAWRYRRRFTVPVYAPTGAVDFEDTPDRWYQDRDRLPGGLLAVHAPGPTEAYYAFYLLRDEGVVFFGDLLTNPAGRGLGFVPDQYQDDPARTRVTVRRLLDLKFRSMTSHHGDPILRDAKAAITQALAQDT
ncbi:MAG: MBL fold metallo-hydrolase [Nitrospirales bacterium]